MSIEALLLSCKIYPMEERDIVIADILGAFMQADMNVNVHLKMEGRLAELLMKAEAKLNWKFLSV